MPGERDFFLGERGADGEGKGVMGPYETVQVVIAMEDIDALCLIPGETLGRWESLFRSDVGVGKGDDAEVDVDGVPEVIGYSVVRGAVRGLEVVWFGQVAGELGCLGNFDPSQSWLCNRVIRI